MTDEELRAQVAAEKVSPAAAAEEPEKGADEEAAVAGGQQVLSPLSGAYLLVILGEPISEEHKAKMMEKLRKGNHHSAGSIFGDRGFTMIKVGAISPLQFQANLNFNPLLLFPACAHVVDRRRRRRRRPAGRRSLALRPSETYLSPPPPGTLSFHEQRRREGRLLSPPPSL